MELAHDLYKVKEGSERNVEHGNGLSGNNYFFVQNLVKQETYKKTPSRLK